MRSPVGAVHAIGWLLIDVAVVGSGSETAVSSSARLPGTHTADRWYRSLPNHHPPRLLEKRL